MPNAIGAEQFLPEKRSLAALRKAAKTCRGCELFRDATQTVFGVGRSTARLLLVGEAPGDKEDLVGKPFVGPAGRLLDWALTEAGIDRKEVYVTNAVKHFRFEERGKRRLHRKPTVRQIRACHPWLAAEAAAINPAVIVCLGSTAAQSLLGSDFKITKHRGEILRGSEGEVVVATHHPSAILRSPDAAGRETKKHELVLDLTFASQYL